MVLIPGLKFSVIKETGVLESSMIFYHENNSLPEEMQHVLKAGGEQYTGVQEELGMSVGLGGHF